MAEAAPHGSTERRKSKKTKKSSVARKSSSVPKRQTLVGKGMAMVSQASNRSSRRRGKRGSQHTHNTTTISQAAQPSGDKKSRQKGSNSIITSIQPSQMKSSEHTMRQKSGDFAAPKKLEMKQLELKQIDVKDEDVRSFLIEQKKKVSKGPPKIAATDLKSQLTLDRITKIKKKFVRKEECEMAQCDDSYWTTLRKDGNEDKMFDERIDNYDYVPKIDDVLKLSAQNVFSSTGLPHWMDYLEPMPDDLKHVEPSCPVGSEQIEMYHEKKIMLKAAPAAKITLDQWQYSRRLKERDKVFFSYPLVFSNTLRSLINVSTVGKKVSGSKETDESVATANNEDKTVMWINLDEMKCHYYDRSDPFGSIRYAPM